ncbi:low molecular weight protein-tyrosine-phosphatase [Tropicibacter naphthalenivorans]|uniref:protein-tyrosine-phosphatase n=1 Tax=Tropicibacter naphthalenivorans TaxID=441103 RepID=A0A0P1G950_9RHOB|nr:low molecular weight protein-tyrosine-phosphatase [Tropicibacter naphthalenivorans]CUH78103.1 Low molecular weight protein-tyrosine-phosphatase YfkJ [Tropicibacter naphthalenivorans]SMC93559.1 protein-tyrosine phosphatase [Tropicibacter naphthalenivorans]
MTYRILFVCLGNICRSPSAEGVVRAMAEQRGVDVELDSAGTGRWHIGEPPYAPMQAAARARGYDLSELRGRQVSRGDFAAFDLIVAMDGDNLRDLRAMQPKAGGAELRLFTDYAPQAGADEIPDPYYTRDFDGTLDLVEVCARGLLDQL